MTKQLVVPSIRDLPKQHRKEMEAALARGWSIHKGSSGHVIWRWKGGGEQLVASLSPSDGRGTLNHMARMRRIEREFPWTP